MFALPENVHPLSVSGRDRGGGTPSQSFRNKKKQKKKKKKLIESNQKSNHKEACYPLVFVSFWLSGMLR